MKFEDIIDRINVGREICDGVYSADCPSCNGSETLAIRLDFESGKVMLRCNNGCTKGQICAALGIEESDLCDEAAAPFSAYFKSLDEFDEQDAKWLFKDWLPEGQITLLAADGGVGKTTLWCDLAAAVSSGKQSILDNEDIDREPKKVLIFTTEDSISQKLKKKLRLAGANMKNIKALDLQQDPNGEALSALTFGSSALGSVIRIFRPALCIFDPVQGFVSPDINMGSRNAMRNALAPLIPLGEECGTTFLIICHSNKRKGAAGRDRIADSADLWDISRSVLMAGYTQEQGLRYLSNEKNNYAVPPQTILFGINDIGLVEKRGTSDKHDRDYMLEAAQIKTASNTAPRKESCRQFILDTLHECKGAISVKDLEEKAKAFDFGVKTLRNAKEELKAIGEIDIIQKGSGRNGTNQWYVVYGDEFIDITDKEDIAWEQIGINDAE